MKQLQQYINQIEAYLPNAEVENSNVSKVNVAWHLDHSLMVINGVIGTLRTSKPSDYRWKFNKFRFIFFTLGFFPRGKAKAPKSVRPQETITKEDIFNQMEKAKYLLTTLNALPEKSNFKHPLFGVLNKKQTVKFLKMHTKHHLKIVDDILKQ